MSIRQLICTLGLATVLFPSHLSAFGQLACRVIEADMFVTSSARLGMYWDESGITVDSFSNAGQVIDNKWVPRENLVPTLSNFNGIRVVNCRTGQFFAIREVRGDAYGAAYLLSGTEYLRQSYLDGTTPDFRDVERAVRSLYSDVQLLQDTAQTCGCAHYFTELRPDGIVSFDVRDDVEYQE